MAKKTVDDIQVKGKRVLVRCDFNVPMKDGKITNDKRIVAALPTIKKLIADGGKVILCSHLGKPKNGPEEKFSLAPVAVRLSELLGQEVVFANDDNVVGAQASHIIYDQLAGREDCELYMYDGFGHAVYDLAPDYRERMLKFFLAGCQ
jgi:phosphoglycerate kinase